MTKNNQEKVNISKVLFPQKLYIDAKCGSINPIVGLIGTIGKSLGTMAIVIFTSSPFVENSELEAYCKHSILEYKSHM